MPLLNTAVVIQRYFNRLDEYLLRRAPHAPYALRVLNCTQPPRYTASTTDPLTHPPTHPNMAERYAAQDGSNFDWYQDFGTLRPHLLPYLQNHQNFEILIPVSHTTLQAAATVRLTHPPGHIRPTHDPHTTYLNTYPTNRHFRGAATLVWAPSSTIRASST